jgi:integrase
LRALIRRAIDEDIIDTDPTIGIKRPKLRAEGWHTWTEAEIAQYEAKHPIGSQARLAFALALYTGQRSSDLIRMGRQHVKDGKISVVQQKTGARLWIPIHPELQKVIDATQAEMTFLITQFGAHMPRQTHSALVCPLGLSKPGLPAARSTVSAGRSVGA